MNFVAAESNDNFQNFLYSIKFDNAERYMMVRIIKDEKQLTKHVPDDIFAAAGKWIGSMYEKKVLKTNQYKLIY